MADNASRDETLQIAAVFAKEDPRIRIETVKATVSQSENVNRAVNLARGDWVQFLCHDDIFVPGALCRLQFEIDTTHARIGLIGHGTGTLYGTKCYLPWGATDPARPIQYTNSTAVSALASEQVHSIDVPGSDILRSLLRGRNCVELPGLTNACVRRADIQAIGGFDCRYKHFDLFAWLRVMTKNDYRFIHGMLTLTRIHGYQVAVAARHKMDSFWEHRSFWPSFIQGEGAPYGIGYWSRAIVAAKSVSIAASSVAMNLLQARYTHALRTILALPAWALPMLPLLAYRAYRRERRRTLYLRPVLNWNEIFP